MVFSDMTNWTVWPPSLSRDRKWPRVTKCMHSRMVGFWLESNLVTICFRGSYDSWCRYKCYLYLAGYAPASAVQARCDSPSLSSAPGSRPGYIAEYCVPVSEVPCRQHLRSARRYQMLVPRVRRGTPGTRAYSVAGPTVWNSLPDCLRDPAVDSEQFRRDLKTYLFAGHSRR